MSTNTAIVLLALLQPPRRPWPTSEIGRLTRCSSTDIPRITRSLTDAGWAVSFSTCEHDHVTRLYTMLTTDGVKAARGALRATYKANDDDPTLILLANSMHPPITLEGM